MRMRMSEEGKMENHRAVVGGADVRLPIVCCGV